MNTKYILPLLACFTFGCGDKDEDSGSEDTSAPMDSGEESDSGEEGDSGAE